MEKSQQLPLDSSNNGQTHTRESVSRPFGQFPNSCICQVMATSSSYGTALAMWVAKSELTALIVSAWIAERQVDAVVSRESGSRAFEEPTFKAFLICTTLTRGFCEDNRGRLMSFGQTLQTAPKLD
jgi:hypothetical protein